MKFYQPQIQLAREHVLDMPDVFYIHVITFCRYTNFRANGYTTDASDLANGNYNVTIFLIQDNTIPEFDYITPVVHTINLGGIAFPGGEGWIKVQVMGDVPTEGGSRDTNPPAAETKTGGAGTVSTTCSDDKSRGEESDLF